MRLRHSLRVLSSGILAALTLAGPALGQDLAEGRGALRAGEYDRAIAAFRGAARGGGGAEAYRGWVRALTSVGRYEDAEAAARSGLEAGLSPDLLATLGQVLLLRGKSDEAEDALRKAVASGGPDRLAAEERLAELLLRRGLRDEALRRFDRFIDYYNQGVARTARDLSAVARAVTHLGARNPQLFKDALRAYDEAAAVDSFDLTPRVEAGDLFLEKYNSADARRSFAEVLEVNPRHPDALLGMARVMDFDGQPGAMDQALRALEVNENLVPARLLLARMWLGVERYDRAEDEIDRALDVNPGSLEAIALLAASRYLQNDTAGYRAARDRALRLDPRYADLYYTVAERAVTQRKYAEAVELAREAVRVDDLQWRARGLLGINLLRLGRMEEGTRELRAAFAGDPYNVWFKNTLDLLDTFAHYRETDAPHFRIVMDRSEAELLAPYVTRVAEDAWAALAARYRYEPPGPIRLEIFPRHADFSVRTVGLTGMGALGVSFGPVLAMDSPSARPVGGFNWASTLWHEVAHSFHMGLSNHEVPRWFTEGLAVLEQRTARAGWGPGPSPGFLLAYREGRMPPPSRLDEGFMRPDFPEQVGFSYYEASLVCQLIEEGWGFEGILEILRGYGGGLETEEVFRQALGLSMSELDRRFDDWIRERFRGPMKALTLPATGDDAQPLLIRPQGGRRSAEALVGNAREHPGDFAAQLAAGRALYEADRADEAVAYLERARDLFPEYGGADGPYPYLARIHRDRGELEEAAGLLRTLLRLGESHYEAHLALADILEETGRPAEAARVLSRAMEIHPFEVEDHERLAGLYESLGRWNEAVRERTAVLALDPVDAARAHYLKARALLRAGDRGAARSEVLRALERAPNYREAQDLLLEIRGGGGAP